MDPIIQLQDEYGGAATSDALVVICEEGEGSEVPTDDLLGRDEPPLAKRLRSTPKSGQESDRCIAAHSAVLCKMSSVIRTTFTSDLSPILKAAAAAASSSTRRNRHCPPSKPIYKLFVPHGQTAIGRMLLAAMYNHGDIPSEVASSITQQQLLDLLWLAEGMSAAAVVQSVCSRLLSISPRELEWPVTVAILRQSTASGGTQESVSDPRFAATLKDNAYSKVRRVTADLELVWALEGCSPQQVQALLHKVQHKVQQAAQTAQLELQLCAGTGLVPRSSVAAVETAAAAEAAVHACLVRMAAASDHQAVAAGAAAPHEMLLELPYQQLKALLAPEYTYRYYYIHKQNSRPARSASEDTVYYTIKRWLQHNPAATAEQRMELAELVQLVHCTPSFLCNEVFSTSSSWLVQHRQLEARSVASMVAGSMALRHGVSGLLDAQHEDGESIWDKHPSSKPPASVLTTLPLAWDLSLSDLREAFVAAEEAGHHARGDSIQLAGKGVRWQGREFKLVLVLSFVDEHSDDDDSDFEDEQLRVHEIVVKVVTEEGSAGGKFTSSITAWKTAAAAAAAGPVSGGAAQAATGVVAAPDLQQLQANIAVDAAVYAGLELFCSIYDDARDWGDLQDYLQQQHLVHPGQGAGLLRFTAEVSDVY